jgi:hypothetical protein
VNEGRTCYGVSSFFLPCKERARRITADWAGSESISYEEAARARTSSAVRVAPNRRRGSYGQRPCMVGGVQPMNNDGSQYALPPSIAKRVGQLRDAFETAWKAASSTAERPHIEDYLSTVPEQPGTAGVTGSGGPASSGSDRPLGSSLLRPRCRLKETVSESMRKSMPCTPTSRPSWPPCSDESRPSQSRPRLWTWCVWR